MAGAAATGSEESPLPSTTSCRRSTVYVIGGHGIAVVSGNQSGDDEASDEEGGIDPDDENSGEPRSHSNWSSDSGQGSWPWFISTYTTAAIRL